MASLFSRWPRTNALLLIAALAVITYWPGLSGHFVFDDFPNIVQNPAVHAASIDFASLERAAGAYEPGTIGRPLATISFAIDHAFHGLDARGWKRTNLAIHVFNSGLVFAFLMLLLRATKRERAHTTAAAAVLAALWAVHPLQASTVLYVVQRMEMLVATSLLLGLLAYLAGRHRQIEGRPGGWALIACSGVIAATGLLSKESAVIFPLLALTLELTLLRFQSSIPSEARLLRWAYIGGGFLAVLGFVTVVLPHYADPAQYAYRDFTMVGRLLSQLTILPMYLQQIVLPHPGSMLFNYDHLSAPSGLFSPPTAAIGGLLLAALIGGAVALRERLPLFSAGVLWFFAAHFLTSNIVPLELAYEHRNYLALLGVILALYGLVERVMRPHALQLLALVALLLVAFLGFMRSLAWGSALSLAVENATNNPLSARAANDLGIEFAELSNFDPASPFFARAVAQFERGMSLPKASPLPEQALIVMHAGRGLPVQQVWWDSMDAKLRTRPIGVQERLAVSGLIDRAREGIPVDAAALERSWRIVDERDPWPPYQRAQFATWLAAQTSRREDALRDLEKAATETDGPLRDQILASLAHIKASEAVDSPSR